MAVLGRGARADPVGSTPCGHGDEEHDPAGADGRRGHEDRDREGRIVGVGRGCEHVHDEHGASSRARESADSVRRHEARLARPRWDRALGVQPRIRRRAWTTRQGRDIFGLWQGSVIVAIFVGGLVVGTDPLSRSCATGAGADELPIQTQYLIKLEVLYTVVPVVIVAVLFAFSYRTQDEVDALTHAPAVTIDSRASNGSGSSTTRRDGVTVTGAPGKEAKMVVPEDRTTRLVLTSPDVIHSFYVPGFLFKRDVIPGVVNKVDITPRRRGSYTGRYAEFCGLEPRQDDLRSPGRCASTDHTTPWVVDSRALQLGRHRDHNGVRSRPAPGAGTAPRHNVRGSALAHDHRPQGHRPQLHSRRGSSSSWSVACSPSSCGPSSHGRT